MAKVYFVRHQAAGILTDFPFARSPSGAQIAALTQRCFQVHGFGHKKTPGKPYWVTVVEQELLGTDAVIEVPTTSLSVASAAGSAEFSVSGTGEVAPAGV